MSVVRAGRSRLLERVLTRTPYLEKEMLAAGRFVPPGAVCLDVGAAGGTWTWWLSRLAGPRGRVFGFEPRPRSQRIVVRLLRLAGADNATMLPLAVGSEPGRLQVAVARLPTMSYVRRPRDRGGADGERGRRGIAGGWRPPDVRTRVRRTVDVEVTTVDAFVRRRAPGRLDFLKIDVEGHELAVLRGAVRTLAQHRPVVLCEIEARHLARYGHDPADVLAWLRDAGYGVWRLAAGRLHRVGGWHPDEHNYLALPR